VFPGWIRKSQAVLYQESSASMTTAHVCCFTRCRYEIVDIRSIPNMRLRYEHYKTTNGPNSYRFEYFFVPSLKQTVGVSEWKMGCPRNNCGSMALK
jgi:hypothetical protein